MALPAINRLPLRSERDRITREGQTRHTKYFTIVSAPSPIIPSEVEGSHATDVIPGLTRKPSPSPRLAILLSKKTAAKAVDRNRIKRVTSAILLELLPQFPPADYLVIPKRSVLETPHSDLLSELRSFLTSSSSRA